MSTSPDKLKVEVLPDDYAQYNISFKMIVIGDAGVGKSCLTKKAAKGYFEEVYSATVGFEYLTFNVKINDKIIKLQIWDTCGQELYRSLVKGFYRNSSIVAMVYAINNKESFRHINSWLKEVKLQSNPDVKVILIGNKSDLEEERLVQINEAQRFTEEHNIHFFCETSAKNGINTQEVFVEAAKMLYNDHLMFKEKNSNKLEKVNNIPIPIKVHNKNDVKRKKEGCCG